MGSNKKNNKKKKKGKKNKKNAQKSRADKLSELKQERQTQLLNYGNNLMGNLDVKYAPHLSDDIKDLWEGQILEAVSFYEDDFEQSVEDNSLFEEKKSELKEAWNEIFELIEEDFI